LRALDTRCHSPLIERGFEAAFELEAACEAAPVVEVTTRPS
jgi:hypothetical protein